MVGQMYYVNYPWGPRKLGLEQKQPESRFGFITSDPLRTERLSGPWVVFTSGKLNENR
jgi:hypothetical protein